MKLNSSHSRQESGMALPTVLITMTILMVTAGAMWQLSAQNSKISKRTQKMAEATLIAESELEYMYADWQQQAKVNLNNLPALTDSNSPIHAPVTPRGNGSVGAWKDIATTLSQAQFRTVIEGDSDTFIATLDRSPFLYAHQNLERNVAAANPPVAATNPQYAVTRFLKFEKTVSGGTYGNTKSSIYDYFTAAVCVKRLIDPSLTGSAKYAQANTDVEVVLAQRLYRQMTPFSQDAILYMGKLEMFPGSSTNVQGPITSNDSIYAGWNGSSKLTLSSTVNFRNVFNGSPTGIPSTSYPENFYETGDSVSLAVKSTPTFTYTASGATASPTSSTEQATARALQVQVMPQDISLLNGLDAATVVATTKDSAGNPVYASENDVQRAMIAPPPAEGDNAVVSQGRLYNTAGIRIEITGGTVKVYAPTTDSSGNVVSGTNYMSAINAAVPGVVTTGMSMVDKREGSTIGAANAEGDSTQVGNKTISITEVDVKKLTAAINSIPALKNNYNGTVYVYDTATSANGIRLTNAALTPNFNEKGFTVATDNGLYIKGDFNLSADTDPSNLTAAVPAAASREPAKASILADAVTVLSTGWDDANSGLDLASRVPARPAATPDADGDTPRLTINAAILTGNTPTTSDANSGGAHNLVRYLEQWSKSTPYSDTIKINGTIAQGWSSKYFNSPYSLNPSQVYGVPVRIIKYDQNLARKSVQVDPDTTTGEYQTPVPIQMYDKQYYRGDYVRF